MDIYPFTQSFFVQLCISPSCFYSNLPFPWCVHCCTSLCVNGYFYFLGWTWRNGMATSHDRCTFKLFWDISKNFAVWSYHSPFYQQRLRVSFALYPRHMPIIFYCSSSDRCATVFHRVSKSRGYNQVTLLSFSGMSSKWKMYVQAQECQSLLASH